VLAYNTDNPTPRGPSDLAGKRIEVVRGSSAVEQLELLRRRVPKLKWVEVSESDGETLLARLAEGKVDYVVTEAHTLDIARKFHPNLARAWPIGDPEPIAWAFPRHGDPYIIARAEDFILRLIYDGTLRRMLDRYYGHVGRLDQLDVANYLTAIRTQLRDYRAWFQEAQELTGIDWRLIAALGFQESRWDPAALSPTGVRGLMMLTADTADRMRVANRLDPRQSIIAGARYLLELKEMLPQKVQEPDRTWLALAAYNLGLGHVEDARVLAQRQGLDPNLWVDVKQTLPLLTRYEYYSTVKRGFCRGGEALALTENIRNYYDILATLEPPHITGLTPFMQSGRSSEPRPAPVTPPL
jgi:membrane-bound lytic murein transglycosylase F